LNPQDHADPIVCHYLNSHENIETVLRETSQPGPAVVKAIITLHEALSGKGSHARALAAAESVDLEKTDPDLFLLFIASWANYSVQTGRHTEAEALFHRGRQLLNDETPPEIKASLLSIKGLLGSTQGDKVFCEANFQKILELLPKDSPRRITHMWHYVWLLVQQGRGKDARASMEWLAAQHKDVAQFEKMDIMEFVNAVETGQWKDAFARLQKLEQQQHQYQKVSVVARRFEMLKTLLELVRPRDTDRPTLHDMPAWAGAAECLLARRPHEALRLARLAEMKNPCAITGIGFESFTLLRAELAAGNKEAAKRLMEMRVGKGNKHFLDDFFLARIARLSGQREKSRKHFCEVAKTVKHYHAFARLNLELSLACEIPPLQIAKIVMDADLQGLKDTDNDKAISVDVPGASEALCGIDRLVGKSPAMAVVREMIVKLAPLDVPVLITGETGTGKELAARAIHESGNRRNKPFLAINCGAIAESLLESELFGHERGAFTSADVAHKGLFQEAGKGTLFLDEIGEISPRLQVALLRVFETNEIRPVGANRIRRIHCRIITATNAELDLLVKEGRFRKDLLFRLKRLEIQLPLLRDRPEDIALLADFFLNLDRKSARAKISGPLQDAFMQHQWPGNVRELRYLIERMHLLNSDKLSYTLQDVGMSFASSYPSGESMSDQKTGDVDAFLQCAPSSMRRQDRLKELFKKHHKLTRSEITKILGISTSTAGRDLKKLLAEDFIEKVAPTSAPRTHYFVFKGVCDII